MPRFAIVILTWNAKSDTLACLERIVPQCSPGDLVVVADNASEDGTSDEIRARFSSVRLVQNAGNLGFAGGVNSGLRSALAEPIDWLFVLNNDTEPPPDLLARLRAAVGTDGARFAVFQPLLVAAGDHDVVDSAGIVVGWLPGARDACHGLRTGAVAAGVPDAGAPQRPRVRPIFGACGAALLCRRDALEQVGLFDEDLFVLFEDVDLAFRLRSAGHAAALLADIRLPHRRGVSAGRGVRSSVTLARRRFWVQRNTVALALRAWPALRLLLGAPILVYRAIDALRLARRHGPRTCGPLWRRAIGERRALRSGLRRHDADRWFGAPSVGDGAVARD